MGPHVYGTIIEPHYSSSDVNKEVKCALRLNVYYYDKSNNAQVCPVSPTYARELATASPYTMFSKGTTSLAEALKEYAEKNGYAFFDDFYAESYGEPKSTKPCGEAPIESNDNNLFGSNAGTSMFNTGTITGGVDTALGVDTATDIKITDSSGGWTITANDTNNLVNYNYDNGNAVSYDVSNSHYIWNNGQLVSSPDLVLNNWYNTDPGAGLPDVQEPVVTKRRINNKKRLKYNGNK